MPKTWRCVIRIILCLLCTLAVASTAYAQEKTGAEQNVQKITANISMISDPRNGNTLLFTGEDGVLLIDTKSMPATEKLIAKIAEICNQPVRFAINTHWHFDHTGGNETLGKASVTIISHENVRKRMSAEQTLAMFNRKQPPSPKMALPIVTFKNELTFHLNGEDVSVFHLGPGHTDGDAIVFFHKANVIHVGDLFFNGLYPYIGIASNGSINSMIKVGHDILTRIDDHTTVVPGHGPLADKAGYAEYLSMLSGIRDSIRQQIKEGKSLEQVRESKPTKDYDAKWGRGIFSPDMFTELVYMDLSRK